MTCAANSSSLGTGRSCEVQHALSTSLRGDLAIAFFDLDADGFAAELFGCRKRCATTAERVKNGFAFKATEFDQPYHPSIGLWARMPVHFGCFIADFHGRHCAFM